MKNAPDIFEDFMASGGRSASYVGLQESVGGLWAYLPPDHRPDDVAAEIGSVRRFSRGYGVYGDPIEGLQGIKDVGAYAALADEGPPQCQTLLRCRLVAGKHHVGKRTRSLLICDEQILESTSED